MSTNYLVELKDLTKIFREKNKEIIALNQVSLRIKNGEFVVIVGPSGCGKSTFLRCIAGLEVPNEGDVVINGTKVNSKPPEERCVEWLPQRIESTFINHKSLYSNLGLGLRIRKVSKEEQAEKIQRVSSLLGIAHLLDRLPTEISGGELQRVAIGRAIMRDSKIFLFDEPLANLDELLRRELRLEFRNIQKKVSGAFIYVTHDQREALSIGTRCVVMNDGKIEQDGTPEDVYYSPDNLFVARFFSANGLNQFPCEINFNRKTCFVKGKFFEFSIPLKQQSEKKTIQAILCARAEDIFARADEKIGKSEISLGRWRIHAQLFLGNETFITTVAESDKSLKAIAKDAARKHQNTIELIVNIDRIYFFDAITKKCIR